jgi:hypothetical protein
VKIAAGCAIVDAPLPRGKHTAFSSLPWCQPPPFISQMRVQAGALQQTLRIMARRYLITTCSDLHEWQHYYVYVRSEVLRCVRMNDSKYEIIYAQYFFIKELL